MRDEINARIDALRLAFSRLTQREQMIVVGGSAGGLLFILAVIGMMMSSAISSAERRVGEKLRTLNQVMALQDEYRAKQATQRDALAELRRNKGVRLVSLVESAARSAGIEIGRLQPQDGEPDENGVVESRVELRASKLSIDRLQDFIKRLERSSGIVIVQRLKVNKPYRKETLDVEIVGCWCPWLHLGIDAWWPTPPWDHRFRGRRFFSSLRKMLDRCELPRQ